MSKPPDLETLAQSHAEELVEILMDVARHAESEPARVAAARELLSRAYGSPTVRIDQPEESTSLEILDLDQLAESAERTKLVAEFGHLPVDLWPSESLTTLRKLEARLAARKGLPQ